MVQLELLDLMISRECGAVPMDAATRADLIDLPAGAFADHVAHLVPTTSVHLLKHGQSVML